MNRRDMLSAAALAGLASKSLRAAPDEMAIREIVQQAMEDHNLRTAIWMPPCLCACRLQITAKWTADVLEDLAKGRVVHHHPIPYTITGLQVLHACQKHEPMMTAPIEEDPYGGRPGYIKLSELTNPTAAQKLYVHLYRYHGQLDSLPCGCQIHVASERRWDAHENPRDMEHPHHTVRCARHKDDHDHSIARAENRTSQVLNLATE